MAPPSAAYVHLYLRKANLILADPFMPPEEADAGGTALSVF